MIESGYKRMSKEKLRRTKKKLYSDPLFKMIYLPLWYQHEGDLTPVEVWQEALMVIDEIKDIEKPIRHLEVSTIVEELNERYTTFDNTARSEEMAQHTTMLVLATVMFMLAEADANWKHNPHLQLCRSISQILNRIEGFRELCRDVKTEESHLAEDDMSLPIRDFIGDEKKSADLGDVPTFTEEVIRRCGLKCDNPLPLLQAIHIIKSRITADNDWIAVYAVLLEMKVISPTMTTFCAFLNEVFGVSVNSRYLSSKLKDHGKDIDKWNPIYDDQKRHLQLTRDFRLIVKELTKLTEIF